MDTQLPLICDTYREALTATVIALGGNKKVGALIWPAMEPEEAGHKLAHCINPNKRETLKPEELALIRRHARQANVHTLAAFEMRDAGYADPVPLEPEDERAALQREFVQASKAMERLFARMERAGLRVA